MTTPAAPDPLAMTITESAELRAEVAGSAPSTTVPRAAWLRWAVTAVATVASACVLDAVATSAGVLLAATDVLAGAPVSVLLAFLAATYVVWGAALRVNLRANWLLLEATGTSTNVLSKLLHDVARLRSSSRRARRAASAAAYVATEVAKEAPFYAAAFGSALVIDGVDGTDAIVFLGGTNVGAAVYELSAARLTGVYLRRRWRRQRAAAPAPAPDPIRARQ